MREMFGKIAPRYDFVTRTFSFGMDPHWKLSAVERALLPDDARVLDLACGTGDFSQLVIRRFPRARAVGVDLTEPMLHAARRRGLAETVCADATALPFADETFDRVFVGYGLRNFPNLIAAVQEIKRVTRPGGMLVSLDFFLPGNRVWRRLFLAYLYAQGTFWGTLLHGHPRIYTYIPDSLRHFVSMSDFAALLQDAGYVQVEDRAHLFGGIGLHWAVRP